MCRRWLLKVRSPTPNWSTPSWPTRRCLAPGAGAEVGSDGGSRVHLVIVQRSQDALYARLTSRPWQEAVTVIWDRRLYERRRAAHQGGRRHGERRRSPPGPWGALGFLVVPRADASP
jgi:hypothetical protein